jgi:hypothetical protein
MRTPGVSWSGIQLRAWIACDCVKADRERRAEDRSRLAEREFDTREGRAVRRRFDGSDLEGSGVEDERVAAAAGPLDRERGRSHERLALELDVEVEVDVCDAHLVGIREGVCVPRDLGRRVGCGARYVG